MGSDIDAVVQRRTEHGRWRDVTPPTSLPVNEIAQLPWEQRNYLLFGVLAGHRCTEATPIAPARGLPEDYRGPRDRFGPIARSWVSVAELAAYDWGQPDPRPHFGDASIGVRVGIETWLPWLLTINPDPSQARLVFGFD